MQQVIADKAEEQFRRFIDEAHAILGPTRWEIGRIASEIKEVCGKSDAEIGDAIGLSKTQVQQRRAVWDRFGGDHIYGRLSWSHYNAALYWDDAEAALQWANDNEANVAEMTAWRRLQNGEDITKPAPVSLAELPDDHIPRPPSLAVPNPETKKRTGDPGPQKGPATVAQATAQTRQAAKALQEIKPPIEDVDSGVLAAMRQVLQLIQDIKDKKAMAAELRKMAAELQQMADDADPPAEKPSRRFVPPTVEQVQEYCESRGWAIDAQKFCDFYASKGWKVGRVAMKDWKAAVGNAYRSADKWCHKKAAADGRTRERDWSAAGW